MSSGLRLKQLNDKILEVKREYKSLVSKYLREEGDKLFTQFPTLQTFSWTQYAPSFNDGDPCYFSVHAYSDEIRINGRSEYDYDDEDEDNGEWTGLSTKDVQQITKKVSDIVRIIDEDCLEELYGDSVEVVVSRKTIKTENYTE